MSRPAPVRRSPLPVPGPALVAAGVRCRAETPADLPFLRALYGEARAEELARVAWPSPAAREVFLDGQFGLQRAHLDTLAGADLLMVTRAGRRAPIGRLCLDRGGACWRIVDIALLAAARGRGLGSALVGWVQRSAGAAGAAGVDLHVARDNPRATALYRRLGFADRSTPSVTHRRLEWCPGTAQIVPAVADELSSGDMAGETG